MGGRMGRGGVGAAEDVQQLLHGQLLERLYFTGFAVFVVWVRRGGVGVLEKEGARSKGPREQRVR